MVTQECISILFFFFALLTKPKQNTNKNNTKKNIIFVKSIKKNKNESYKVAVGLNVYGFCVGSNQIYAFFNQKKDIDTNIKINKKHYQ